MNVYNNKKNYKNEKKNFFLSIETKQIFNSSVLDLIKKKRNKYPLI